MAVAVCSTWDIYQLISVVPLLSISMYDHFCTVVQAFAVVCGCLPKNKAQFSPLLKNGCVENALVLVCRIMRIC
jgi:hypothetical protein